jgi:hypothetical protein
MADNAPVAEGSVPNLHKDEVTGEMVSKSELKKRQKKREADAKKVGFGSWESIKYWSLT